MKIAVDPDGPSLHAVPSNPVPEGGRAGYFLTKDKVRLRYALFQRGNTEHKGTVCLVQGRAEFIEKYFETVADFQKRGFAVALFDLRGQGGSDRLIEDPGLGYVEAFDDYWTDLASFHGEILLPDCPPPFYLVGHSTGGLVALLAAARDRLMFDRAFLCSPMLGLPGLPLSHGAARAVMNAARFVGLSRLPLARRADKPMTETGFENNVLTGDKARFLRTLEILKAHPHLEIGAPTIAWIASALTGILEAQAERFPQNLKIPVFIAAAACDRVVSTPATEALALRMRTGHHAVIAGARHEMLMETDAVRAQIFAAFDAFVTHQSA